MNKAVVSLHNKNKGIKMIAATELRIGNKFQKDGIIITVRCVTGNVVIGEYDNGQAKTAHTEDEISPVTLTTEMLIKAGFEREVRNDRGDEFVVWFNNFDLHENSENEFYFAVYVKGTACSFKRGRQIKYLHELQNLHLLLNGKELTFTP